MPETTKQTHPLTHEYMNQALAYFVTTPHKNQGSLRDVSFILSGGDAYTIIYDFSFQPRCYSVEEIADCFDGGYEGLARTIWEESQALWMADHQEAGA
jgi:hypothetical protein